MAGSELIGSITEEQNTPEGLSLSPDGHNKGLTILNLEKFPFKI